MLSFGAVTELSLGSCCVWVICFVVIITINLIGWGHGLWSCDLSPQLTHSRGDVKICAETPASEILLFIIQTNLGQWAALQCISEWQTKSGFNVNFETKHRFNVNFETKHRFKVNRKCPLDGNKRCLTRLNLAMIFMRLCLRKDVINIESLTEKQIL